MMVVRREGSKGKLGNKIVRTLAAGMVVVPGVLSNPMLIDQNTSFADSPLTFPSTMYVGQHLDVRNYVTSDVLYLESSAAVNGDGPVLIGLVYDSSNYHLVAEIPGTYTIYIYEYPEGEESRESTIDITVKYPDSNDDGVDIGDLVKYITTQSEVAGQSGGFSSEQVNDMLGWINHTNKEPNHAPELVLSSELSTEAFMIPTYSTSSYFDLSSNSYVTDQDDDFLSYKVVEVSPANSVKAWIQGTRVVMSPGSVPADSTVTVRAYDGHGGTVELDFTVDMNNYPMLNESSPIPITAIKSTTNTIDLNDYFFDPDDDDLTYQIQTHTFMGSSTPYLSSENTNELKIYAYPYDSGGDITITATDEVGLSIEATFTVTYTNPTVPE